jgi:uncharacterized protein (TIGR02001 family)
LIRSGVLGAALFVAAGVPAYAASEVALSGSARLTTDYVYRGITNSAEKPAVQPEFDLAHQFGFA